MGVYEVPARGACHRAQAGSGTGEPSAQPCQHTGIHGEIEVLSTHRYTWRNSVTVRIYNLISY